MRVGCPSDGALEGSYRELERLRARALRIFDSSENVPIFIPLFVHKPNHRIVVEETEEKHELVVETNVSERAFLTEGRHPEAVNIIP